MMIKGVAIISDEDGKMYTLPEPNRHHHVIHMMAKSGLKTPIKGTQGFYDETDTFLSRRAAVRSATISGQLNRDPQWGAHGLFSEDIW